MTEGTPTALSCRFCATRLEHTFADLGTTPLANSYLDEDRLLGMEPFLPLHVFVCSRCLLVQLPELETPEAIFSDYAYFSSYSDTWLEHARRYCLEMTERFGLGAGSQVVEVASNDGYLLKNFLTAGVPVLGVEPAANVARAAEEAGVPTRIEFFGRESAERLRRDDLGADLLLGNNVLAHVPDLNDFVAGLAIALAERGVLTLEFPHLLRLMVGNQFDTIYHEHFSYFSFTCVQKVLAAHDLEVFDVQELPTHGGSLRVFAQHREPAAQTVTAAVGELLERERSHGLDHLAAHLDFDLRVRRTKRRLLEFLVGLKDEGKSVVGYGAPAKGNTLLNFCGIGTDFLDYTVDRSPHKQGRWLPGSRIPIFAPRRIFETRPDYVFILPWNLREEIAQDLAEVASWGGRLFVAIPEVTILG